MKKHQWLLGLVLLAALAALVLWGRHRIHFDFGAFRAQVALADWRRIVFAVACIYFAYLFRAARWSLLLRHNMKVPLFSLIGTQIIGFTAVALIGRVADPVRPYLVAKRTGLPLSTQIAVYIVERLFDIGSLAIIFSTAMIWVPANQIMAAAAHTGPLAKLALVHPYLALLAIRYSGLAWTFLGASFLVVVRVSGERVASGIERRLTPISAGMAQAIAHRIRVFHSGLDTMRSASDFALTTAVSLAMWTIITTAYLEVLKAFVNSPELASISLPKCVLLMVASGSASIIQLPVLGWFSQIGLMVLALNGVLGASTEALTAAAATLLLVTFLSIIPVGLVWARFEHVSLRKLTSESGHAEEELAT